MKSILVQKIVATNKENETTLLEQKGRVFTFLNPVSYLNAMDHQELFLPFDGILVDGSLLVAAIRCCYHIKVHRYSFDMTSLAAHLLKHAKETGKTIYIVGDRQKHIERSVMRLLQQYPGIRIVGFRNGFFATEDDEDDMARSIARLNPDYLIVGMGSILQEKFLLKVKKAGFKGIGFTCGGFVHQIAQNPINYYPEWIDRMNLRFIYRMYKEPYTRIRYLKAGLQFPIRFIWERIVG